MKKITFGFILSILVLGFVAMQKAPDVMAYNQIGYGTVSSGQANLAVSPNTSKGGGNFPIYQQYGVEQNPFAGCSTVNGVSNCYYVADSITISTSDSIQLTCFNGSVYGPGVIITGPGTFYPTTAQAQETSGPPYCANQNIAGNYWYFSGVTVIAAIVPNLTSASVVKTVVTVYGANFSSTGNTVAIKNSSGVTTTVSNVSSSGGTSLSFTLPAGDTTPGNYTLAVEASGGTTYSNSVSFTVVAPDVAPVSLTATRSSSDIDQINLSWAETGTTVSNYSIERAFGPSGGFSVIATVSNAATHTYMDDLSGVAVSGNGVNYRVKALFNDGTSAYTNIANVSNCISISGNGSKKIVFMHGNSLDQTLGTPVSGSVFMDEVNATISTLKLVDPYKTHWSQFSFYTDLGVVNDTNLPSIGYTGGGAAGVGNGVSVGYI